MNIIIKQLRGFGRATMLTPVFTSLEVLMGVLIPYVTSWIIDRGISAGSLRDVFLYGGLMVVLAFFSLLFGILAGRYSAQASTGFAYNLREAMYKNIQTFSFSNIDRFSTGGLITRMTTDVQNMQRALLMILRASVRAPLNLVFSVLMCVFISFRMSLIFVVALVVLGVSLYLIISRTVKLFAQVFLRYDDLNSSVQENVAAIRVVKAFVREEHETKKFSRASDALSRLFVRTESLQALTHPVMMLTVYGCMIALSWFGAHFIVVGDLTTGQLTSLFTYVMTILSSLMMLSMTFVQITMSAASAKRIVEVIEEKADIANPEADAVGEVADGTIDFEHVCFSYGIRPKEDALAQGDTPVGEQKPGSVAAFYSPVDQVDYAVYDVSLRIRSGETIGIIGGTGCGKSTLAMLVSRLYDVTKGSVKVGGVDVRQYDLEALRNAVSMVLQNNTLFAGSILDNLRWGKTDATLEECREACRLACADEFIDQMPDGYETRIEQNGANVSGGQKQRLCIARALLKQPKILVLDDSTSACDRATEAKISRALHEELPGVTKLIVAQRIQSVQACDRILVMDNGRVVGFDTHAKLLQSCEVYQEIYRLQMEGTGDFDSVQ